MNKYLCTGISALCTQKQKRAFDRTYFMQSVETRFGFKYKCSQNRNLKLPKPILLEQMYPKLFKCNILNPRTGSCGAYLNNYDRKLNIHV